MEGESRLLLVEEHTGDRPVAGCVLPFELGRKAGTGPRGERVGLVVRDVDDGLVRVERAQAGERVDPPPIRVVGVAPPVEGRLPALGLGARPAVGLPQFGPPISAVVDEREPFTRSHQAIGQREVVQPNLVARPFVVEGEAVDRRASVETATDLDDAAVEPDPTDRARIVGGGDDHVGVRRTDRGVHRQDVLDVDQQEFLVLLLVMGPENERRRRRRVEACTAQVLDRLVDVRSVVGDLGDAGPVTSPRSGRGCRAPTAS